MKESEKAKENPPQDEAGRKTRESFFAKSNPCVSSKQIHPRDKLEFPVSALGNRLPRKIRTEHPFTEKGISEREDAKPITEGTM